jgi:hypothetical protein
MPQHRGSRSLAQALATFSRLQKFNGKRLDLFFVTVANSFLGERVGNKNSNFSKKI